MHSNIWGEEDNIYEDPDGDIYRVSSKAHVCYIISSDHMISVSKLNSLYNILVKFFNCKAFPNNSSLLTFTTTNLNKLDTILFYSIQSTSR
jgi:hypothetical protein